MLAAGVRPNDITMLALIAGYAHNRRTADALSLVRRMRAEFGIQPDIRHHNAVLDTLGRAGLLQVRR